MAVEVMSTLNKGAAAAMRRIGALAATDVTGFGLLGHLGEMARASGVSADIDYDRLPLLDGLADLVEADVVPGGSLRNLTSVSRYTRFGERSRTEQIIAADAQTSGGLLIAVDAPLTAALLQALEDEGVAGHEVGSLTERTFEDGPGSVLRVH